MIPKLLDALKFAMKYPALFLFCLRLKRDKKTFLSFPKLESLIDNFMNLKAIKPEVNIAEFGVGRGGSAELLYKLVSDHGGHLTLYDVFGRIPPPSDKDGQKAAERYQKILQSERPDYYGNIQNLRYLIESELNAINPTRRYTIVEGKYEDTLPGQKPPKSFDLVHIDCDWYDSVKIVLTYLRGSVSTPGIIQYDDWDHWQGVKTAADEFDFLSMPDAIINGAAVIHLK